MARHFGVEDCHLAGDRRNFMGTEPWITVYEAADKVVAGSGLTRLELRREHDSGVGWLPPLDAPRQRRVALREPVAQHDHGRWLDGTPLLGIEPPSGLAPCSKTGNLVVDVAGLNTHA